MRKSVDLGLPIGRLSRVDAIQQQHMALAVAAAQEQRIHQITAALAAVSAGTYGYVAVAKSLSDTSASGQNPKRPFASVVRHWRRGDENDQPYRRTTGSWGPRATPGLFAACLAVSPLPHQSLDASLIFRIDNLLNAIVAPCLFQRSVTALYWIYPASPGLLTGWPGSS